MSYIYRLLFNVYSLQGYLNAPMWETAGGKRVTPNQVWNGTVKDKEHMDRINNADTRYPIVVNTLPDGRLDVIDGLHRLKKLDAQGATRVQVVDISTRKLHEIALPERVMDGNKTLYASKGGMVSNVVR